MEVPDEDLPLIIHALERQADYLKATKRDENPYREMAERLKRKGPGKEEPERKAVRKRG